MKEDFRRVLQITITKWNLALWSKSVSQRFQEEVLGKAVVDNTYLFSVASFF